MNGPAGLIRGTTTGKILFIALLAFFLLLPLQMIEGLIAERAATRHDAAGEIARTWGEQQTIGGPFLVVPMDAPVYRPGGPSANETLRDEFYLMPEELSISGTVTTEVLRRGIYDIPVYSARLSITGLLRAPALEQTLPDAEPRWDEALLALPLSDPRSITDRVTIDIGSATAEFGPGGTLVAPLGSQLVVRLADLELDAFERDVEFRIDVSVGGAESIRFLPLGDVTSVALDSNWPTPSFQGAYLPVSRAVSDDGFEANWQVLAIGRGFPASFRRSSARGISVRSFGVDLMPPLSVHAAALKATKYGVLFVGLSFVAFLLFEVLHRLRLHGMHYLSVGMANVVFYLLLLAIAEHTGFGWAYLISVLASTSLITGYAAAILGGFSRAGPIALLLIVVYLQLYAILNAADFAVLIGSLTLFGLLAGFMYLTRHVDWYELDPVRVRDAEGSTGPA